MLSLKFNVAVQRSKLIFRYVIWRWEAWLGSSSTGVLGPVFKKREERIMNITIMCSHRQFAMT